jgi:ribosomal protein S17
VAVAFIQFPKYVPYLNYAFGGSGNASKYLSDSNVDWGQDGVRLAEYIKNNPGIDKIAVDYFGGADMRFYLCDRKYDPSGNLVADVDGYDCSKSKYLEWHVDYGKPNTKYIAVSETYLVSDIFYQKYKPRDYNYQWLRDKTPVVKIGDSIYIYEVN